MAKRTGRGRTGKTKATASPKDIAVKKKLLLLTGKAAVGNVLSLAPDDIRVEPIHTRATASRLITGGLGGRRNNIVWADMDSRDSIRILDTDPEDRVVRIDFDPNDPIPEPGPA